jgi:hypothetical protein
MDESQERSKGLSLQGNAADYRPRLISLTRRCSSAYSIREEGVDVAQ